VIASIFLARVGFLPLTGKSSYKLWKRSPAAADSGGCAFKNVFEVVVVGLGVICRRSFAYIWHKRTP
jgi:hypothetical protein